VIKAIAVEFVQYFWHNRKCGEHSLRMNHVNVGSVSASRSPSPSPSATPLRTPVNKGYDYNQ
jgi:hypothetical protein